MRSSLTEGEGRPTAGSRPSRIRRGVGEDALVRCLRSARSPSLARKLTSRTPFPGCVRDECAVFAAEPPPESLGLASQHGNFWNLLALCFGEYV